MPSNAIAGCDLSPKSVQRVLNGLSLPHSDFLVKLRFSLKGKRIVTPLYGVNLPLILKLASVGWDVPRGEERVSKDQVEDRPNRKPSNLMLQGRCLLDRCVEFTEVWNPAFKFLTAHSKVIEEAEGFIRDWKKHFPSEKEIHETSDFEYQIKHCRNVRVLRQEYLAELDEFEGPEKIRIKFVDLATEMENKTWARLLKKHPIIREYLGVIGVIRDDGRKINVDSVREHFREVHKGQQIETLHELLSFCETQLNRAQ